MKGDKSIAKQAQDAARDERYRRREERRRAQESARDRGEDADVWEYVSARLGISSPSEADAAVVRLRNLNKRIAEAFNA